MIRRYGEAFRPDTRYKRRPGVYCVLLEGDHVLLTHQQSPVPEFQLPGGGIDPGEHPLAALHREVREETGWKIDIGRHIGTWRRFVRMPEYGIWAEKVCSVYLARPVRALAAPTEPGHTAVWLPVDVALHELGSEGDRAMLARALQLVGG